MKTLIITAHPSSQGFTHKIAKTYKKSGEKIGKQVEIIDLYSTEYSQTFLRFESQRDFPEDSVRPILQQKIQQAEEIILVFPVWWGSMPAIMKNFFDMNLTSGFSFRYTKRGCLKLLKGKVGKVFCTCDGPGLIYTMPFMPDNIKYYFKIYVLGFFGIDLIDFKLLDRKRKRTTEDEEKFLKKIERSAQDLDLGIRIRKYLSVQKNKLFPPQCDCTR